MEAHGNGFEILLEVARLHPARDEMFLKTDTAWAPWRVAKSDDKKRRELNIITDLLKQIPYETTPRPRIELPKRDKAHGYVEYDYASKLIPEVF